MRLTDHMKKAVGLWPPKAPYITLRHALSGRGDVSGLPLLLRTYPDAVRWEKKGDMQPLHYAVWQGNYAAAAILIEHDHSILDDAPHGKPPLLHKYAAQGDAEPLSFLIRQGADVNRIDSAGYTPLHHAARQTYSSTATAQLLKYGARPDIRDKTGRTPLMLALAAGHKTAADALMTKPYEPQQTDNGGNTLLIAAAESGFTAAIVPLLRAGVSLHATLPDGRTALDVAIDKRRATTALVLLQAAAPMSLDEKRRRKLGNLIRPLEGSTPALKIIGLRPSPQRKQTGQGFTPF